MLFHVIDFDMVNGLGPVVNGSGYQRLVFCINCGIVFVEDVLKQNLEVIEMAKERWIAKATSKNKGKFSAAAKKAGMSTAAYAKKVTKKGSKSSTKLKREANLAKTLKKFHK